MNSSAFVPAPSFFTRPSSSAAATKHVPGGKGAAFGTVAPELRLQSDWSRHKLKANLVGSYSWYNPDYTPTLNRPYMIGVGLTYKFNRWLQLKGEFRQDWLRSNQPGNDYTSSTVLFGIRVQE